VAIARAFLENPRLLICDEATSALDSATEGSILRSLKELAAGRTCVFVAHRLSTIKHCDHILVRSRPTAAPCLLRCFADLGPLWVELEFKGVLRRGPTTVNHTVQHCTALAKLHAACAMWPVGRCR